MKKNLHNLIIALLFVMCCPELHAQTTDSVITVLPKWKKGDTHIVKIKVETIDEKSGVGKTYTSNYTAVFKILGAFESGYSIEWTYTNAQVVPTDPMADNHLFGSLLNTPIRMDLKKTGVFTA